MNSKLNVENELLSNTKIDLEKKIDCRDQSYSKEEFDLGLEGTLAICA